MNMETIKNILCYGDSNTWGFVPGSINFTTFYMERYARHIRWTGLLQEYLGNKYHIIESGLNARTTNINTPDLFPDRNGKTYLAPCLYSHAPLDLVILFLGANDLKIEFNRGAKEVATGLAELIDIIQSSTYGPNMKQAPAILLISYPIPVSENSYKDINNEFIFKGAINKAKEFSMYFSALAEQKKCHFWDAAPHIQLSDIDGIHFDEKAHQTFAELLCKKVEEIII
jgi:lysophospholipase L1-like esterase